MMSAPTTIFEHDSVKSFLCTYHAQLKESRPQFSYSSWSKLMGIKNNASLFKIMNGERRPGNKLARQMENYFGFAPAELEYFRLLVLFEKAEIRAEIIQIAREAVRKHFKAG